MTVGAPVREFHAGFGQRPVVAVPLFNLPADDFQCLVDIAGRADKKAKKLNFFRHGEWKLIIPEWLRVSNPHAYAESRQDLACAKRLFRSRPLRFSPWPGDRGFWRRA